jgi:Peptidase A4 family
MRKLPRAGAVAAAALTAAASASAFTLAPAARPLPASGREGTSTARAVAGRLAAHLRPGGPLILARSLRGRRPLPRMAMPRMGTSNLLSRNWGGYAAVRPGLRFRSVQATYFVPFVDCTATPGSFSSHWTGLDGLHSNTVEQVGVLAACSGTSPVYLAWFEMFPLGPVFPAIRIRPGDTITSSVSYRRSARRFTLSLTDTTNGQRFTRTAACPARSVCGRTSAEAISEAPSGSNSILPLTNFRAEGYSSVQVVSETGHHGTLRGSAWGTVKITTANQGGMIFDQPTALSHGSAFGMYWLAAG